MKKESLIFKILTTMITAVLIPFMVVFGMLFYTEWSFRELTNQSSNRVLTQFLFVVDNIMLEASDTVLGIGNNKQCQAYSRFAAYQPEKTMYQALVVRDELTERNNVKYYDIFVYYPQDDQVISAMNGAAPADDYFAANYPSGSYSRDHYKDILQMEISRPHVFSIQGQKDYLCVGMRQSFRGNENRDFVAVLVMRPEYLGGLTLEGQEGDEGVLLIYDRNKDLIVGNTDEADYSIDWYSEENAHKDINADGSEYTIHVQAFSSVDGYCAYAVSTHVFWDTMEQVRIVLIAGLLICLIAGAFAVFRGTKKVYAPIGNVVKEIKNKNLVQTDTASNEMELIREAVSRNVADKHRLNRLNKESAIAQKRKILHALMQESVHSEELSKALETLGVEFLSDCFAVCVVCIRQSGTIDRAQQEFVIENVFTEIAQNDGAGYLADAGDDYYVLLLNFRTSQMEQVDSHRWEEACRFLKNHYDADVAVCFSEMHFGVDEISAAFHEATTAQKYCYLLENKMYIDYAGVKDRKFSYVSSVESKLSRMIVGYLKERDHSIPEEQFVDQVMESYGINEESSIDTVECFKYELIGILHKAIAAYGGSDQSSEMLEDMMRSQSLTGFRNKLIAVMKMCMANRQVYSKTQDLCKKVEDYIKEFYSDSQLSMDLIGQKVHMSPYYLSKLFKAERGISVPSYIARVRIDEAKKQLRETNKSIVKIAEETGFMSSTVFIRNFRKAEGVTPGVYRSMKE